MFGLGFVSLVAALLLLLEAIVRAIRLAARTLEAQHALVARYLLHRLRVNPVVLLRGN